MTIKWLAAHSVVAMHARLLVRDGGLKGPVDEGRLESTLARPRHLLHYQPDTDLFALAASYGFGLVKNHCFKDGNKRIGLAAMLVFLRKNGYRLDLSEPEAVFTIQALAAGDLAEPELVAWLRANSRAV